MQKKAAIERLESRVHLSVSSLPRPDHIVVVVEEDHAYDQILGPAMNLPLYSYGLPSPLTQAPYLWQLASLSASFTNAHSVGSANQTDYQALISGLPPQHFPDHPLINPDAPNLAQELIAAGMTFGGYAESLPSTGFNGGNVGLYQEAHNPWVALHNIPAADNMPFSKFPADLSTLPTVSFVVPNQDDNMHSGTISNADNWLHDNIGRYAKWAMHHNSLLIVTWDESHERGDPIPTLFFGPMIDAGNTSELINQYNILRTMEDMYGVAPTGLAASATPITDIYRTPGVSEHAEEAQKRALAKFHGAIRGTVKVNRAGLSKAQLRAASQLRTQVYLDTNNDGVYEVGEPTTMTIHDGRFHFLQLPEGSYVVRAIANAGYAVVSPATGSFTVTLSYAQHVSGLRFSETLI